MPFFVDLRSPADFSLSISLYVSQFNRECHNRITVSILDPSHPTIYLYRLYLSSSSDLSLSISVYVSQLNRECIILPSAFLLTAPYAMGARRKESCVAEATTVFQIDPLFVFQNDPPADFKWVSASHVGSIGRSSTAILWLCWHCWHHLGKFPPSRGP